VASIVKHAGRLPKGAARDFTSEATPSPAGENQTAKPKYKITFGFKIQKIHLPTSQLSSL
jgi:hypothetical protein